MVFDLDQNVCMPMQYPEEAFHRHFQFSDNPMLLHFLQAFHMGIEIVQLSLCLLLFFIDTIQKSKISNRCRYSFRLDHRHQECDPVYYRMITILHQD